jgi:hypothetical protein
MDPGVVYLPAVQTPMGPEKSLDIKPARHFSSDENIGGWKR